MLNLICWWDRVQGPSFPISGGHLANATHSRRHAKDRFRIGLIIVVRVAIVEIHIPCVTRIIGLRGSGPEPKRFPLNMPPKYRYRFQCRRYSIQGGH